MDIIDIALAKNFAKKMAAGFTNVEVDGMNIIFTLIDGQTVTLTVPTPADGVSVTDLEIDENGDLICSMSDGTEINAGKALPQKGVDYFTEEEIEEFKDDIADEFQEQIDTNSEDISEIQTNWDLLESNFDPKTETLNENGLIEDALNWKVKYYSPIGKTNQDSYTGKNLFNINGNINTKYNGTTTTSNSANGNDLTTTINTGTTNPSGQKIYVGAGNSVTLSAKIKSVVYNTEPGANDGVAEMVLYNDNTLTGNKSILFNYSEIETRKSVTFTATTDYIFATFGRKATVTSVTYTDIQVEIKSTMSDYEPYVGGVASPNPDFQQPIENVTGDVKTETSNINLFDESVLLNADDWSLINGYYTGTSAKLRNYLVNAPLKLGYKENTQYTIIAKGYADSTGGNARWVVNYTNGTVSTWPVAREITETTNINTSVADRTIDSISFDYGANKTIFLKEIMLVEGAYTQNEMPSYAPHQGKSITFPLSQGQKMYEGDYLANDGIHHVRNQKVFDGTETYWYSNIGTNRYSFYIQNNSINAKLAVHEKTCNKFIYSNKGFTSAPIPSLCENTSSARLTIFNTDGTQGTDVTSWKTWLATQYANNTPLIVEYELENEVIEPYTSEQQTAWNELQKLETYKKQTHIYTSSDEVSPGSKITYLVNPLSSIEARLDLLEA